MKRFKGFIISMVLLFMSQLSIGAANWAVTPENGEPFRFNGIGNDTTTTFKYPLCFYFQNSLSQTIYYPDEGLPVGFVPGLTICNKFATNLPAQPIKVWLAETSQESLASGWIPYSEFTLVFDGLVDFPQGENAINIFFTETFSRTGNENLVVMFQRPMDSQYYSSNDRFFYSTTPQYPARNRHAYSDSNNFNPENPPPTSYVTDTHPNLMFFGNVYGNRILTGVVSHNGLPIQNAFVYVGGQFENTDANGNYTIYSLLPTIYTISVNKTGYYPFSTSVSLIQDTVTVLNIEMTQITHVDVKGLVVGSDAPNTGVPDLPVLLTAVLPSGGQQYYTATTTTTGHFTLKDVPVNKAYQLDIERPGFQSHQSIFTVGLSTYNCGKIIMQELVLPVMQLQALEMENQVHLCWQSPLCQAKTNQPFVHQNKAFQFYHVFRLKEGQEDNNSSWDLLSNVCGDTSLVDAQWAMLDDGFYKYAVMAEYSNNLVSEPAFSNVLEKSNHISDTNNAVTSLSAFAEWLHVYPVPASDRIFIKSSSEIISLAIIDVAGRSIYVEQPHALHSEINTCGLHSGIYFLQIQTPEGWIMRKVLIDR